MKPNPLKALSALRLDWAVAPDDVWHLPEFHVDELHRDVQAHILGGVNDAATSAAASPLGVAIIGTAGAGKTHLLGSVREKAQAEGAYFFLISLGHGSTFWESTALCVLEGLQRPSVDAETQLKSFIRRLAMQAGVPMALHAAISGDAPLTPEDLNQFVAEVRRLNRKVGLDCRDTAKALVLYGSADPDEQDIGYDYLLSMNEIEPGIRLRWGLRAEAKPAQRIVSEISHLLALTGPTVMAVDQIDTLLARHGANLKGIDVAQDAAAIVQLNLVADGLMSLREVTRRTLCLVSCLPSSWELIESRAAAPVRDRFRRITPLSWIGDADIAATIVAKRFDARYRAVGYAVPYPTWPVKPEVFPDAVTFTPRGLLQAIDDHVQSCLRTGEFRELARLGDVPPTVATPPADGVAPSELDQRFDDLRRNADVSKALSQDTEDTAVPQLLAAGLAAWIDENSDQNISFVYDPLPGPKPLLHAVLRRVHDSATGEESHWAFRAIAHNNATAALFRLRGASTKAGLAGGDMRRRLFVLRNVSWANGEKTQAALAALRSSGGDTLPLDVEDLKTFAALQQMRHEAHTDFPAWLAARRHASSSKLFSTALADALADPVPSPPDGPRPPKPSRRPKPKPVPDGTTVALGWPAEGDAPYRIELESLRRHCAIFAGSGSGKTVLIRRLVEECALRGVSAIVLDPNNDLARLGDPWPEAPDAWGDGDAERAAEYLAHTDVRVWTPRREAGCPLSFQPLPDFRSVLDDPDELAAAIEAAAATLAPRAKVDGATQKAVMGQAVLREALGHFARSGGSDLRAFVEVLSDLPSGVSQLDKATKLAADMAEALKAAMVIDPMFGGDGTPVDPGLLLTPAKGKRARVSVISFVGLPSDDQRQSFVNQLQMALFAWIKKNPAGDRPLGGLFVMDEAQTLAPSGAMTACTQSTLALASQARKYGLGLVFATQAPKGLHNRIPGNATTQLFGLLNAPAQIDAAREMARAKGGDVPDIARLRTGQFYAGADGMPLMKVQTPLCLSHHPRSPLTTEEVIERARRGCDTPAS